MDAIAGDVIDLQPDLAIVEQQHVAGAHVARQIGIVEPDPGFVAYGAVDVEHEFLPALERDFSLGEFVRCGSWALADSPSTSHGPFRASRASSRT